MTPGADKQSCAQRETKVAAMGSRVRRAHLATGEGSEEGAGDALATPTLASPTAPLGATGEGKGKLTCQSQPPSVLLGRQIPALPLLISCSLALILAGLDPPR